MVPTTVRHGHWTISDVLHPEYRLQARSYLIFACMPNERRSQVLPEVMPKAVLKKELRLALSIGMIWSKQ
jgi:hypothetical protein